MIFTHIFEFYFHYTLAGSMLILARSGEESIFILNQHQQNNWPCLSLRVSVGSFCSSVVTESGLTT